MKQLRCIISGASGVPQKNFFGYSKIISEEKGILKQYVVGRLQFPAPAGKNSFIIWHLENEAGFTAEITKKTKIIRLDQDDAKLALKDFEALNSTIVAAYIKTAIADKMEEPCRAIKIQLIVLPT